MKPQNSTTPALDPDATPQAGGSYIRQPDGTLVRAVPGSSIESPAAQANPAAPGTPTPDTKD